MTQTESLRANLAARIAAEGISMRELERRTGRDKASYMRFLKGTQSSLALDLVEDAARALGTTTAELLGQAGPAHNPALDPATIEAGQQPTEWIDLNAIQVGALNPRKHFDVSAVQSLAESIAQHGLLQSLVVRRHPDGRLELVAGERRYRALCHLRDTFAARPDGIQGEATPSGERWLIPCRVIEIEDQQHLVLALLENLQRQDLSPLEEAEAFAELQRTPRAEGRGGWSTLTIAEAIGKTQRYVQQRLALLRLDEAARQALAAGEITTSQARALAGAAEQDHQRQALTHIRAGDAGWTTEDEITAGLRRLAAEAWGPRPTQTAEPAEDDEPGTCGVCGAETAKLYALPDDDPACGSCYLTLTADTGPTPPPSETEPPAAHEPAKGLTPQPSDSTAESPVEAPEEITPSPASQARLLCSVQGGDGKALALIEAAIAWRQAARGYLINAREPYLREADFALAAAVDRYAEREEESR